ncbi:hypothetical protein PR202_gb17600 [Eleusine coracana subsp. coracana]|uniref:Pentatricopeptide repeat-containing protein-mitochondrial domain-containing protein n=1 Tax=Eleusine coracana subsp. coracana TaxID=191504 RepID=A0AAV5F3Y8_ELECO|nr:hypothetical protein PR202_gb17600 [Eleusine coracana subsp. coracana]
MPLMAVASPHFPFPSSSTRHLRRAATAIAAATSSSGDFDYPLADPSVRWPNLSFPHLPAPRFPATVAPPAPVRPPQAEEDQRSAESTIASTSAAVEPLDARAHRTRVKKLSKLALRRAQDWRERVAGMADAILALPPGAPVDDVLDGARASADEVALVLRAVGERSWRRALDAFEWLARGGAPAPRAVAVVLGVLGRARQDAAAEEVFVRFAGDGATVQVFNAMMGVYARSGRFDDVRQLLDAMRDRGVEPDLVSFNTLINAMAKSGCLAAGVALDLLFEEAERLFTELLEKGFKPDAISYNSLLYAYAKEGDADNVERVCEELVKAGFTKNEITYNTMIHMYGKMGRLDLAIGLYDERAMGCAPDTVTYTVLIDSLGKMDRIAEAGTVLEEMVDAGLKPTLVTFSALICAYAKGGRQEEAEKTFDGMVESGVKPDRLAYLVMLDIFARSGETKKLMDLYRTMMKDSYRPDDGLYQVLLAALAKGDEGEVIEEVIHDMELVCQMSPQIISTILMKAGCIYQGSKLLKKGCIQGYEPDRKSLVAITDAYIMMGKHEEGFSLLECIREHVKSSHDVVSECFIMLLCREKSIAAFDEYSKIQMLKYGSFGRESNLYEYLITCLEEAGFCPEACQVFSDMQLIGVKPSRKIYESVISAYCKLGFPETAHMLMDDALAYGVSLNILSSRVIIIEAYGKMKLWQKAESFVKGLRQASGIDRRIWNALIFAYAESGLYEKARAVFDNMMKTGLLPTVESINGMMRALIVDDRLDELYVVVQQLQDMDFKISKSTVLLMLDAFARAGDVFEVMKIYNGMKAAGYLPSMHLYRSMISLLCHHNRFRDAELMVAEMKGAGLTPDLVILNALLMMYTVAGNFDRTEQIYHGILEGGNAGNHSKAEHLLAVMKEDGVEPTISTMHILMTSYGSAGHPHEAESVLNSLKASNMEVSTLPYSAVLDAYLKNGDYNLGITKLLEMKRDGVEPDHQVDTVLEYAYETLLTERTPALLTEVDNFLEELGALEDSAALNFVNALEDLLWAFERRATASWIFQLAAKRGIYHNIFRVIEKDWGADFRKLSAGAALVGLTLWLDHMQDASLQGSPEPPKSIVLVTGEGEYNRVSLHKTIRAYLMEMGSPFLPSKTRSGLHMDLEK